METFCIICHNQEFSKLPNGKAIEHKTFRINEILCSTCTQFCIAKSLGKIPWEGKEKMKEMIQERSERKLKRREK